MHRPGLHAINSSGKARSTPWAVCSTPDDYQFDFVPDGRYRFLYAFPDGTISKVHGRFTNIRRPELVEFTWTWEPPDPHADEATHVTWRIEVIVRGTRLVVTHERIPDDYLPVFRPGSAQTIQHLAEVLGSILHERK